MYLGLSQEYLNLLSINFNTPLIVSPMKWYKTLLRGNCLVDLTEEDRLEPTLPAKMRKYSHTAAELWTIFPRYGQAQAASCAQAVQPMYWTVDTVLAREDRAVHHKRLKETSVTPACKLIPKPLELSVASPENNGPNIEVIEPVVVKSPAPAPVTAASAAKKLLPYYYFKELTCL